MEPPRSRTRAAGARRAFRVLAAAVALAVALAGTGLAQTLPDAAAEALQRGQRAAAQALIEYSTHVPDAPLWADALEAGREAALAAPEHPAPQRFLAQAYLQVGWYARSWTSWQAYLRLGGDVDATAERQIVEVARWMGLATFDQGRRDQALPYLETLLRFRPDDLAANARLARYHLDAGDPSAARPYLQALDGRVPELEQDLLRAQRLERYGAQASTAYEEGLLALSAGAPVRALDRFVQAANLRPEFVDAWRRAGETALRLGRTDRAEEYLQQVLRNQPDDAVAFAALGRVSMAAGDLATAVTRFERAAELAPGEASYARALTDARSRLAEQVAAADEDALAVAAEEARAADEAAAERARAEAAAAETEAAEAAAAEAADAEAAAAEQAAAEQAAAEQAGAEEAAQAQAEAQADAEAEAEAQAQADAEAEAAAERARAEDEAAERARAEAEAEAARRTEAAASNAIVIVDATTVHRRDASAASSAVTFLDAPELAGDLAEWTDGTLHVRIEVSQKPSRLPVLYQLCFVPHDITVRPACTDAGLLSFTESGAYEAEQPWSSLAGFSGVDWSQGVDSLMVVLRRQDGSPIDATPAGGDDDAGLAAYLPMTVHLQAVGVPSSAPFPGWP